ncbi:hypothetical protein DKY63_28710 [Pseudomonas putida]|uniref:Uncharacterized protein n=1 Tax=Pseudomonas putida TaxID=303 RepID=A0A2Z4RTS4_PSEPU|nr:hypothetical protein DKY63_28710 [Pseudomonas putida]
MWERACSRNREVSQYQCWLTYRFREQARSHIFYRIMAALGGVSVIGRWESGFVDQTVGRFHSACRNVVRLRQ